MNIAAKYESRDLREIFAQGFPLKGALVIVTFEESDKKFKKNRNLFFPQKATKCTEKC